MNLGLSVSLEMSLIFPIFRRKSETDTSDWKDRLWPRKWYMFTKCTIFLGTQEDYIFHISFRLGWDHLTKSWPRNVSRNDVCYFQHMDENISI